MHPQQLESLAGISERNQMERVGGFHFGQPVFQDRGRDALPSQDLGQIVYLVMNRDEFIATTAQQDDRPARIASCGWIDGAWAR